MQLVYLGNPPLHFLKDDWGAMPEPLRQQAQFEVDVLFVFAGGQRESEDYASFQLVESSGRPVVLVGAVDLPAFKSYTKPGNRLMVARYTKGEVGIYRSWLADRPRSNYETVGCECYDRLEGLIVGGQEVSLTVLRADGNTVTMKIRLVATKTRLGEEYVQLSNQSWIRLDHIRLIEGSDPKAGSRTD